MAFAVFCFAPATAIAQSEPNGPFQQTCKGANIDAHGTLIASCQNFFYNYDTTSLPNANQCTNQEVPGLGKGAIWNVDGVLRCIFSQHKSQSGRDIFDIISIQSDVKNDFGETKVWRIDHPDVIDPQRTYEAISFKPGDTVEIVAGGCVQTGGHGATWKLYTNPSGSNADDYYSGQVQIPSVIPSLVRIGGELGFTHFVPLSVPPTQVNNLKLTLGYQDDERGDNGYYSHDDGNNNQCAGVGPAWVMVSVVTNSTLAHDQPKYSPHSKDFDMTWDTNGDWDANGLPVNARWGHQVDHPNTVQDFNTVCGPAFNVASWPSDSVNVDEGKLASLCTSQMPATDLSTNGFDEFFTICRDGVIPGHLNWSIATYTGPIFWDSYSGGWPNDSDYNFWLKTPDQRILTNDNTGLLELEFNGDETVAHLGNPWWKSVIGSQDDGTITGAIGGHFAVVTGLIGIDGAHADGHSESHPVFSMAIRLSQTETDDSIEEKWVYFIRNSGNQGGCSHLTHTWPATGDTYYVSLPWPSPLVTGVQVLDSQFWKDDGTNVSNGHGVYPGWTYIKFGSSDSDLLLDGEITLHYKTTPGSGTHKAAPIDHDRPKSSLERDEPRWDEIAARFPDPATRTAFMTELTKAKPALPPVHQKRVMVKIDHAIRDSNPPALAARKGEQTHERVKDDPMTKVVSDLKQPLLEKYKATFPGPVAKKREEK